MKKAQNLQVSTDMSGKIQTTLWFAQRKQQTSQGCVPPHYPHA
jgi:hypothetical protein